MMNTATPNPSGINNSQTTSATSSKQAEVQKTFAQAAGNTSASSEGESKSPESKTNTHKTQHNNKSNPKKEASEREKLQIKVFPSTSKSGWKITSDNIPEFQNREYVIKEVAVEYARTFAITFSQHTGVDTEVVILKDEKGTLEKNFPYNKYSKLGPEPRDDGDNDGCNDD